MVMKKLITLVPVVLIFGLTGCAGSAGGNITNTATGDKYKNSETVEGLIYMAKGTPATDAPDDAIINIAPLKGGSGEAALGEKDVNTLLPWTKTTGGATDSKVSMTVESLSSDGEVECQIFFQNMIIHNKASGDHAKVTCEGTLEVLE